MDAILLSLTLQKRTMYKIFFWLLTHLSNIFAPYIKNLETYFAILIYFDFWQLWDWSYHALSGKARCWPQIWTLWLHVLFQFGIRQDKTGHWFWIKTAKGKTYSINLLFRHYVEKCCRHKSNWLVNCPWRSFWPLSPQEFL